MRLNNGETFDFYVNKEKRTVVAVLTVPENLMGNEMLQIIGKSSGNNFCIEECAINESIALKGRYVGKASCHEEDAFDEEKGIHLAKLRALRSYMKDRKRVATRIADVFDEIANRFENAEDYCEYAIEHIEESIKNFDED